MKFVSEVKRTHYCGQVTEKFAGQTVVVMGWVDGRRDHGGLVFLDLRAIFLTGLRASFSSLALTGVTLAT